MSAPLTLAELLAGQTDTETLATLVALAALAGFPGTSWQEGSVPRTFFELEAPAYASLTQLIASITSGGFVAYAEGPWLDLCAAQLYNLQRTPARFTRGTLRLTDEGGVGPLDVSTAGQLFAESLGVRFRNVTTGTLALDGTLDLTWEAEFSGAEGNVPDASTFTLSTTIPGVTVEQVTPPGGTWLSTQGADEEADEPLRERCRARWGELGAGVELAYKFWAATASAQVTRTALKAADGDGTVVVYVAGPAGPIDAGEVTAITNYLKDPVRKVQCVRPSAQNASTVTVSLVGTVKVRAAQLAAAQAAAVAALTELFSIIPLGGVVYRGPIEVAIMAGPGVVNVALSNPAELQLGAAQVPVVSLTSLVWQAV